MSFDEEIVADDASDGALLQAHVEMKLTSISGPTFKKIKRYLPLWRDFCRHTPAHAESMVYLMEHGNLHLVTPDVAGCGVELNYPRMRSFVQFLCHSPGTTNNMVKDGVTFLSSFLAQEVANLNRPLPPGCVKKDKPIQDIIRRFKNNATSDPNKVLDLQALQG
jgi:hypothetical protein